MSVPFNEAEVAVLTREDFTPLDAVYYVKSRIIQLGCGCCSDADRIYISKSDDGTFHVSLMPYEGPSESKDLATIEEAVDFF